PLGSPIKLRRNFFIKRGDLGDSHSYTGIRRMSDLRAPTGRCKRFNQIDHGGRSKVLVRIPPTSRGREPLRVDEPGSVLAGGVEADLAPPLPHDLQVVLVGRE